MVRVTTRENAWLEVSTIFYSSPRGGPRHMKVASPNSLIGSRGFHGTQKAIKKKTSIVFQLLDQGFGMKYSPVFWLLSFLTMFWQKKIC